MGTIGFYSPYKHLPEFKKFIESRFRCVELVGPVPNDIDYIFYAPNYANFTLTDKHIEGTGVRAVLTPSTGTNHLNIKSVPVYDINHDPILDHIYSTAEHNIYLCLHIVRHVQPIVELKECTLGIMGYGRLGKMLESIGERLFKKVLRMDLDFTDEGFFSETDFLSININGTGDNYDFIDEDFIGAFQKNIYIINTARGEVVDEESIIKLINQGKVKGYATDVIKDEHTHKQSFLKLIDHPKVIITPHIGGTAITAQEKAYKEVLKFIL